MRRITLFAGLLGSLVLVLVVFHFANAQEDAPLSQIAHQTMIADYTGPETCAQCHPDAADEVVHSLHYLLQAPADPEGEPSGMLVGYRTAFASVASINWLELLQPADESLPAQPGGCGRCHAGLGAMPSLPPTEDDLANVDCLICHSPKYQRTVVVGEDGALTLGPVEGLDLLAAAQAVQRPTNALCGRCHLGGAGGANYGSGDYPSAPRVDVHLAAGLQCVDCHRWEAHRVDGDGEAPVACTDCHEESHAAGAGLLDLHAARVACQTCHIPLYARDPSHPTQSARDYTQPVLNRVTGLYEPQVSLAVDRVPTYDWGDDDWMHTGPVPADAADDAQAKLAPWKTMTVIIPVDGETDTPIAIQEGVYRIEGDLDAAVQVGLEASGQTLNSAWEPAEQVVYYGISHQVAPAAEALTCADCHVADGRLDFAALGYPEERIERLVSLGDLTVEPAPTPAGGTQTAVGFPSEPAEEAEREPYIHQERCTACHYLHDCGSCHDDLRPPDHYMTGCASCHDPADWRDVTIDHTWLTRCESCHSAPEAHYPGPCRACHSAEAGWSDPVVSHAGFAECAGCHSTVPTHYAGQCANCHNPSTWDDITFDHAGFDDCLSCHGAQRPAGHYGAPCTTCHNTQDWAQVVVDHTQLTDCATCHTRPAGHWSGPCSLCHTTRSWAGASYTHSGTEDCAACHAPPAGHWSAGCSNCHNPSSWRDVSFDHSTFTDCAACHTPPAGHYTGQCSNCHNTGSWADVSFNHSGLTDCASCHTPPAGHYPGQCSNCHNTGSWPDVTFNHSGFTDCASCHTPPAGHYPGQCSNCHNTSSWPDVSFDHSGYTDCASCHTPPAGHYPGQCSNCHNTSSWPDVSFDHTGFDDCASCHTPPDGHYIGQCSNCHNTSSWGDVDFDHTGYTDCISCHLDDRPDPHPGAQCSNCHTTESWDL